MASIFPGSPSLNDIFTSNGTTWQWNGEAWTVVASDGQTFTNIITSPSSQTITADSPTDTLTIAAGTNIAVSANSSNDTLTISSTIDTQDLINTASAAAYASASGYTNFIVDGLDTLDIEENTNLYFTNQRAIDATSSLITSASANALSEANEYTNSASSSLVGYVNTASSSLVNYTDSASASLIAYTNSASSSLVAYTNQEVSALQLFSNISTSPSTQLITGDSNSDTLTFISGENISINADSSTDSITINSTGNYSSVDSITYPDYINFDISPSLTTASTGGLYWDTDNGTLSLNLTSDTVISLGQTEHYPPVINNSGTNIDNGDLVMVTGVQGGKLEISKAVTDGTVGFDYIIGFATRDILDNDDEGHVIKFGYINNVDTQSYPVGTVLYANPTIPGKLTNAKPDAPAYRVPIAIVIVQGNNTNNGKILTRMTPASALGETDSNVKFSGIQNDDLIVYNSASSIWVNEPLQNYLNSASVSAYNAASGYTDSQINALTTSDIEEGTNLYFTNERAINSGSATYILQTSEQGIINTASAAAINYVIDSAPGALDTLNELAAALGDDENFATTVTNSLSEKLSISSASSTYATKIELENIDALPSQTGNDGKYLTTDGASASWGVLVIPQAASATLTRWSKIYSSSATVISGPDDSANILSYTPNLEQLYINGILVDYTNYVATSGSAIILNEGVVVDDVVDIISLDPINVINNGYTQEEVDAKLSNYTRWVKTLSGSATLINGNDDNSLPLNYTLGNEEVYVNGILLKRNTDYDTTSVNAITLTEAALSGDTIEIITLSTINLVSVYTQEQSDDKYLTPTTASTIYLTQSSASVIFATIEDLNNLDALPNQTENGGKYLTTNGASASWATLDLSTKADRLVTFDLETTSYTLTLLNSDQVVEMNVSSANNLTVPLNSSVPFSVGTQITILQTGTGQTTINPTEGVTVNATPGLKLRTQWSSVTLIKRAENTWVAIGDLVS